MTSESQALLHTTSRFPHHVTVASLVAFINNARLYTLQHYHYLHLAFINSARLYMLQHYHQWLWKILIADSLSPRLQDVCSTLGRRRIAHKMTPSVTLRLKMIVRMRIYYDLSCRLPSCARAPTSAQSMVIALSYTFVDGHQRGLIRMHDRNRNSTHKATTTGHSVCS